MKRIVVLIAILALLVTGATVVLADPIQVGGTSFTSSALSPIQVGGTFTALAKTHGNAYGLLAKLDAQSLMMLSPIQVGGT